MLGRAVMLAAGAALLAGPAEAQTTPVEALPAKIAAKAAGENVKPMQSEPDPLTPPEVTGPAPAAPAAPTVTTTDTDSTALADPVLDAVRRQLGQSRSREAGPDATDRAALAAHYASDAARVLWSDTAGFTERARQVIDEIGKADDWGLKAAAFELPTLPAGNPGEDARARAEILIGLAVLKYARHARGGRVDPLVVSKLHDRRPQPYEPGSLLQSITVASKPDAYLRDLHPRHAGFRQLQKALVAARSAEAAKAATPTAEAEPPQPEAASRDGRRAKAASPRKSAPPQTAADNIRRIVVNMERWRWMPDNLGAFHVWNNVPEQVTNVYKDGKVVFTERIVVGKPDTATPNFTANMQFVIFQPEWGVPSGIKNNEIAPLLRRASTNTGFFGFGVSERTPSTVLARHGLRVSYGGQVVNPDNINWSSVDVNRFNFIQPAGPTNVLGVVKFRFPNKHDVYMHDTPQKHLFSSPVRAFSHGCMRVQNPVRFAEVLLEHDKGWTAERVRGMVPRGGEIKLTSEIPVHNVYFTAIADEDGKVRTAGDIYGLDSRIASALEGRTVAVASRSSPTAIAAAGPPGEAGQRVVRGERPARKPKREAIAAGGSSNPFAGLFGN